MFSPGATAFVISTESCLRRRVFHHYDGVRAWRHWGAGHDGIGLASIQCGWDLTRTCFDFSDYFELGWKLSQIGCADRIAVAGGSRKGRDVAVGGDGFGEDSARGVEQAYGFVAARRDARCVVFDSAAGVFKGRYEGLGWRGGHGEMIVEGSPLLAENARNGASGEDYLYPENYFVPSGPP